MMSSLRRNFFGVLKGVFVFIAIVWFAGGFGVAADVFAEDGDDEDAVIKEEVLDIDAINFSPQVKLPGFDNKNLIVVGDNKNGCETGYICVKTLSQYMNSVYKYVVGISVSIAIVLIMIGGVEWMIGSSVGTIDKAKKRITNAVSGLFILLLITTILNFVNPNITSLGSIKLSVVKPVMDISPETVAGTFGAPATPGPIHAPGERTIAGGVEAVGQEAVVDDSFVTFSSGQYIHPDVLPALEKAGSMIKDATGGKYHLLIASGLRSPQKQTDIWFSNCYKQNRDGKFVCNPLTCNPFPRDDSGPLIRHSGGWTSGTLEIKPEIKKKYPRDEYLLPYLYEVAENNKNQSCPHVTGHVVDVWCTPDRGNWVRNVDCHIILEAAMIANGFRRIPKEAWHFEYNTGKFKAPSFRSGTATVGRESMGKNCFTKRHGADCEFDYLACSENIGGSGFANFKTGCCVDKDGICCDGLSGKADAASCGVNFNQKPAK